MKKILIMLLTAAVLLCAVGCRPAHRDGTDALPSGNIHTEFPGMTVSIAEINTHDGVTQLDVLWRNKTPYDVIYGESYAVERLEDGQWVSCEKEDAIFIAIGYELKAGEEVSKTYTVSDLFDVSLPGTYRFKTSCRIYANAPESTPCELTEEFTVAGDDHIHQVPTQAQTVADPVTGYCGNTQTTLYVGDQTYTFMFSNSVALTDLLVNLNYNSDKVCRCMPQYTVDTEFGSGYQIHLDNGFARCEKGQAALTQEQIDLIAEIIDWAESTNCQYDLEE